MNRKPWIHTAKDGRGDRDVFLDGKLIDGVVYANTKRGTVRVVRQPIRADKWRKRVLTKTLHGAVVVVPKTANR